jgi:4-amino-4-deoxy-L-arabinose transferase-like glycosyltransferase
MRARVRGFHAGLAFISVAGLAYRVWYVLQERGRIRLNGDAQYYHWQANDIAHGLWFIDPTQYREFGRIIPSADHPPVYILYLAAVSRFIGQSELTHRLASCLLGGLAIFVIGLVGRELVDERVGLLAAAAAAVYASLWINDEMLMSESAYVLISATMVLWAIKFWKRPTAGRAALMGAAIALAALTRPEALLLFPFLALPYALARGPSGWRIRTKHIVVSFGVGFLVLAPWLGYNIHRFQKPVLMSNGAGSVLMVANCDQTYHGFLFGYWYGGCAAGQTDLPGDESQQEAVWRKRGLTYIRHHESRYPIVAAARVARMWDIWTPARISQGIGLDGGLEGRGIWQSQLATDQYFALLIPALAGLWVLRRRKQPVLPFIAIAATLTLTAASTFGITRYRASVDAMTPVLAAVAVFAAIDAWNARRVSEPAAPDPAAPDSASDSDRAGAPVGVQ